jgi:hypothetical protein
MMVYICQNMRHLSTTLLKCMLCLTAYTSLRSIMCLGNCVKARKACQSTEGTGRVSNWASNEYMSAVLQVRHSIRFSTRHPVG